MSSSPPPRQPDTLIAAADAAGALPDTTSVMAADAAADFRAVPRSVRGPPLRPQGCSAPRCAGRPAAGLDPGASAAPGRQEPKGQASGLPPGPPHGTANPSRHPDKLTTKRAHLPAVLQRPPEPKPVFRRPGPARPCLTRPQPRLARPAQVSASGPASIRCRRTSCTAPWPSQSRSSTSGRAGRQCLRR